MKAASDIRTRNKSLHFQPPANFYNMNQLASMWESKIGHSIPRLVITEDHLLSVAAENVEPRSFVASFTHDIFIKGCQIFKPDRAGDVEIGTLYPEEKIRSLEECFEDFVLMIPPETKKTMTELIRESGNNNSTITDNGVSGNSNDTAAAATNSAVVKTAAPISAMC